MKLRTTATILALAGLGIAGGSATAAPATSSPREFHVYGTAVDIPSKHVQDASLTVDRRGDLEALAITHAKGTPSLTYFTKSVGTRSWHVSPIARSVATPNGDSVVQTDLVPGGERIIAVYATCDGALYTTGARATARTLPRFSEAASDIDCGDEPAQSRYVDATADASGRVAVLLNQPVSGRFPELGVPLVTTGAPGATLGTPQPLPNPGNFAFIPLSISSDVTTGELTVDAFRFNATTTALEGVYVWTKRAGSPWTNPQRILSAASLGNTPGIGRAVAIGGHITIPISSLGGRHPLSVIDRTPNGRWHKPTTITGVRHVVLNGPVLGVNRRTGVVHAVFDEVTRQTNTPIGMFQTARVHGTWSHLRRLTRVDGAPTSVGIDKQGHPIVGYWS